ncbi:Uncharacterised protein [Serratia quinivorans]|nr:hypothetical protein [Serratia quinivorans]CAI2062283.1 Uncharacterised protein [Serratia quinivorans]
MLTAIAITGAVWICLLIWLVYRWCKFCRAFNRAAAIQPEQRNYD